MKTLNRKVSTRVAAFSILGALVVGFAIKQVRSLQHQGRMISDAEEHITSIAPAWKQLSDDYSLSDRVTIRPGTRVLGAITVMGPVESEETRHAIEAFLDSTDPPHGLDLELLRVVTSPTDGAKK